MIFHWLQIFKWHQTSLIVHIQHLTSIFYYILNRLKYFWLTVNLQIYLFGLDRFSLVTFLENNHTALKHLFLKDYQSNGPESDVVVYTRKELYDHLHYAHEQVCHKCLLKSARFLCNRAHSN